MSGQEDQKGIETYRVLSLGVVIGDCLGYPQQSLQEGTHPQQPSDYGPMISFVSVAGFG